MNANIKLVSIICIILLFILFTHVNSDSELQDISSGAASPSEFLVKVARAIKENNKELLLSCYHISTKDEEALAKVETKELLFSNTAKDLYNIGTSKFGKEPFLSSLGAFRYVLEN